MQTLRHTLIASVILTTIVLAWTAIPLGIPGEWQWARHDLVSPQAEITAQALELAERFLPPLICGLFFAFAAFRIGRTIHEVGRRQLAGRFVVLLIISWAWLGCVQKSAPIVHQDAKPLWVLYDSSSSGYFYEAVFLMQDTTQFLAGYEERMQEGEVLHIGTHPPGLFLVSRGCLDACRTFPSLTSTVQFLSGQRQSEAFRILERAAGFHRPLNESELAALQLLSLLTRLVVVLTIIPLAFLARRFFNRTIAWQLCCLWTTLPCLAIFLPKSDALFPLLALSVIALVIPAMERWRSLWLAIPAGVVLWLGLMLSLAHLVVFVLLAGVVAVHGVSLRTLTPVRPIVALLLVAGGCLICAGLWSIFSGCNLFAVWQLNLSNHEGFYGQFTRTWWKWTLVNPLELAFAVGFPLIIAVGVGLGESIRRLRSMATTESAISSATFCAATALTWAALWLSGKNQGEAARLWCFLTPCVLLITGIVLSRDSHLSGPPDDDQRGTAGIFHWLLATQLLVCVITVSRVNGFSF